jgi:hypothetical protein
MSPERVDGACADFLRRVAAPPPRASFAGRLGFAAALMLGAVAFWAIFAWRGDHVNPPGHAVPAGAVQADDDAELEAQLKNLRSASFEEQGRAADALERRGVRATAALERAAKDPNPQLRDWALKILEKIRRSQGATRQRVMELIPRLSSDDFAEQGRAAEEIRKIGKDAVRPLQDAREQSKDQRMKTWIDKLLAAIEKDAEPPRQVDESRSPAALLWLARHQNADGSWGAKSFEDRCLGGSCGGTGETEYNTGLTAITLLAFLGAGYTTLSRDENPDPLLPGRTLRFGSCVKKGLQWLLAQQDADGCVGERGMKYTYNHAAAALCLAEAYGMTASQPLREPAQRAIDFLVAAQNPGKGWRYSAKCGDNDSSVSGWAVFALKSAELSGLQFPKKAYDGATAWLNEATEPDVPYQTGYNARGTGKVYMPGINDSFEHHPTMSAIAITSRIFMGEKKESPWMGATNLLVNDLPQWGKNKIDFYYWYFGSLALFQYDGPSGPMWKTWNESIKGALVATQRTAKDGCRSGSWDPDQERWGREGGRIYTTAMGMLTLETYYRYSTVWGTKKK